MRKRPRRNLLSIECLKSHNASALKAYLLFAVWLAPALPALAGPEVSVVMEDDSYIHVVAMDDMEAPQGVLWETLTDYDHLATFIPDMQSSRVISAAGEPMVVRQTGAAKFLGYTFPLDVTFQIETDPPNSVRFHSIAGNLVDMTGSYRLEPDSARTRLHYDARFRPDFWFPSVIGPVVMKGEIEHQFQGLAQEARRRALAANLNEAPNH